MAISNFTTVPIKECGEPLVTIPRDEFAQEHVYLNNGWTTHQKVYIREGVLERLRRLQNSFAGNYYFLIWDPWRSREVQGVIYEYYNQKIRSENTGKSEEALQNLVGAFVTPATDMKRIPPHSTGGAIDLTLLDSNRNPVDMGTGFDDTSSKAITDYFKDKDSKIHDNRMRFIDVMAKEGGVNYIDEWWHFDFGTQLGIFNSGQEGHAVYGEISDDFKLLQDAKQKRALKFS
jgi:D-alanyl-D-alanine dipeptidase